MPRRRGPGNLDRFVVYMTNSTATGALVAAPCFLYSLDFKLSDGTTSGLLSFADTTAAGDVVLETARWDVKIGTAGASGNSDNHDPIAFNPPLNFQRNLYWANSTGIAAVNATVYY